MQVSFFCEHMRSLKFFFSRTNKNKETMQKFLVLTEHFIVRFVLIKGCEGSSSIDREGKSISE